MIALVILGHTFDGVSIIAGAIGVVVISVCLLVLGLWFAFEYGERHAKPEGVEEGTYGDPGPKFGREG